jgi:hypothetical protein
MEQSTKDLAFHHAALGDVEMGAGIAPKGRRGNEKVRGVEQRIIPMYLLGNSEYVARTGSPTADRDLALTEERGKTGECFLVFQSRYLARSNLVAQRYQRFSEGDNRDRDRWAPDSANQPAAYFQEFSGARGVAPENRRDQMVTVYVGGMSRGCAPTKLATWRQVSNWM